MRRFLSFRPTALFAFLLRVLEDMRLGMHLCEWIDVILKLEGGNFFRLALKFVNFFSSSGLRTWFFFLFLDLSSLLKIYYSTLIALKRSKFSKIRKKMFTFIELDRHIDIISARLKVFWVI